MNTSLRSILFAVSYLYCSIVAISAPSIAVAQSNNENSPKTYTWSSSEIANFIQIFERGCNEPSKYRDTLKKFESLSVSPDAAATAMVFPRRNNFQVFLTDVYSIEAYYPDSCVRANRIKQCRSGIEATAQQACDCLAGFSGDVEFGVGAGELVIRQNRKMAIAACASAAEHSTGELRARYLAQLGKAKIHENNGTFDGAEILKSAIRDGYLRANVEIARAYILDVELWGESEKYLLGSRKFYFGAMDAGAKEVSAIANSMLQVILIKRFDRAVFEFLNEMSR